MHSGSFPTEKEGSDMSKLAYADFPIHVLKKQLKVILALIIPELYSRGFISSLNKNLVMLLLSVNDNYNAKAFYE